jgi:hypothetical protein
MSIESWKEEFYPEPASGKFVKRTDLSACRHSLRKWRGLTKENLQRHGLTQDGNTLYEELPPDSEDDFSDRRVTSFGCLSCILYKVRGGQACDSPFPRGRVLPVYSVL